MRDDVLREVEARGVDPELAHELLALVPHAANMTPERDRLVAERIAARERRMAELDARDLERRRKAAKGRP